MDDILGLCAFYFHLGLSYPDILMFLAHVHKHTISMRTLKRVFKRHRLFRRRYYTDLLDVAMFVESRIESSGNDHGYRWMHLQCIQHGMTVSRETVARIIKILDPMGVELRLRKRLRRRQYFGRGPDYIWHLDSYDKLKQYGLCINGCIDGFSRAVIWMSVYKTSSNPSVIGGYYMEAVQKRLGCPYVVRGDRGTENGHDAQMQEFLSNRHSFLYGRSTANQRIEMFWNFLRKQCCQFWIDALGILKEDGHFTGDFIDTALVQFCLMNILQDDIDKMVHLWNTHLIRPSINQRYPHGRPVVLYAIPQMYGTQSYLQTVEQAVVDICKTECTFRGRYPCDEDVFELCVQYMAERQIPVPKCVEDGLKLYSDLRNILLAELYRS